jgi:hypothetical protein
VVLLALTASACHHEYLFAPDKPPRVDNRHLMIRVEPGEPAKKLDISSSRVIRINEQGRMVYSAMSNQQFEQLYAGEPLEGVDAISIKVDNFNRIWEDYTVPGGVLGAGLGLAFTTLVLVFAPDSRVDGETLALGATAVGGLGMHGMLWGSLWGFLDTQGSTDHRLDP